MDQMTTDVGTLIEQGNALLLGGQVTEAAAAFSQAVELDQSAARAHLGVAEANLALGAYRRRRYRLPPRAGALTR